ncbi:MAG: hypothetical protein ACO3RV_08580, partial [Luteolibacter sp.]
MKHSAYLIITAGLLSSMTTQAAILITQYYEGTSSNKWIEITNTGNATVDLGESNYVLSIWQNANTEAYKTDGIPSQSMSLSGVLTAG